TTVAVNPDGDDHGGRDDAARLAGPHVGRVEPKIGPIALDRPVEKGLHLAVDFFAKTTDLALGDPGHAHRLDQLIDRAGRDTLDVGLPDDRGQRLLGRPTRLEKAREVRKSRPPSEVIRAPWNSSLIRRSKVTRRAGSLASPV